MFLVSHLLQLVRRNPQSKHRGYYLLRFYKPCHRGRLARAVQLAQIEDAILIDAGVDPASGKVAVHCRCDMRDAESLFFQHYALVKQEERNSANVHRQPVPDGSR